MLGDYTFNSCEWLSRIVSRQKAAAGDELRGVRRGELVLPTALEEVGRYAFDGCNRLKVVCVEEDCTLDVRKCVGRPVEVRRK